MTRSDTIEPRLAARLRDASGDALTRRSPAVLRERLGQGCWIYGAGGYGRLIHRLLKSEGVTVRGFIDRRASELTDLPVGAVSPDSIGAGALAGEMVVIALHNYAADQAPVVEWVRSKGCGDPIIPAELPDLLGPSAGSYWLTSRSFPSDHADAIEQVANSLADAKSVEVLSGLARFRATGNIAEHPDSHLPSQYFPPDVPLDLSALRIIDGGAYTGDICDAAKAAGATIAEWYAFEPDPVNFRILVDTAKEYHFDNAALFPCGLGAKFDQIRFSAGEAAGSHVDAEGDSIVQVVAFDEVLPAARANFVKLDVEGYERQALEGMRETLRRDRPQLAVAIYHQPQDLWELPLLVRELLPDAKLYIRQHGFNGFDTVLYAVP